MQLDLTTLSDEEVKTLAARLRESAGTSSPKFHVFSPHTNACTRCGEDPGLSVQCDVQPIGSLVADDAWQAWQQ